MTAGRVDEHTLLTGVGGIYVAVCLVQGQVWLIVGLRRPVGDGPGSDKSTTRCEDLNTLVPEIGDIHLAARTDGHRRRLLELAGGIAGCSPAAYVFARRTENLDP